MDSNMFGLKIFTLCDRFEGTQTSQLRRDAKLLTFVRKVQLFLRGYAADCFWGL